MQYLFVVNEILFVFHSIRNFLSAYSHKRTELFYIFATIFE